MAGLSSDTINVEKLQNIPGTYTPIMKYTVPPGVVVNFPMNTRVVMKLYNSSGDEISEKSQIVLKYKKSDYVTEEVLLTSPERYFRFKNLDRSAQLNQESSVYFKMTAKLAKQLQALGTDTISFPQDYVLMLEVNSTDTVDWSGDSFVELVDVNVAE